MRFLIPAISAAVLGAPSLAQAPSEWKTFTSAEGRFSVRVPGTPREEEQHPKPDSKAPDSHSYLLTYKDAAYIITYTDFPAGQASAGLRRSSRRRETAGSRM